MRLACARASVGGLTGGPFAAVGEANQSLFYTIHTTVNEHVNVADHGEDTPRSTPSARWRRLDIGPFALSLPHRVAPVRVPLAHTCPRSSLLGGDSSFLFTRGSCGGIQLYPNVRTVPYGPGSDGEAERDADQGT